MFSLLKVGGEEEERGECFMYVSVVLYIFHPTSKVKVFKHAFLFPPRQNDLTSRSAFVLHLCSSVLSAHQLCFIGDSKN